MKKLTGNEIRKMWLTFFQTKNHAIIPSALLYHMRSRRYYG